MASSVRPFAEQKKLTPLSAFRAFPTIGRISWQSCRRSWHLLGITWVALLVLVALVCLEPLLGRMAFTIQIQQLAQASSTGSTFTIVAPSKHPTVAQIQQIHTHIEQLLSTHLGTFVGAARSLDLKTPDLQITSINNNVQSTSDRMLDISAYDPASIADQVQMAEGRLPGKTTGSNLEIALSETTAQALKLGVGSSLQVRYPASAGSQIWKLSVVGIIKTQAIASSLWNAQDSGTDDGKTAMETTDPTYYNALAAQDAVLPILPSQGTGFLLIWNYPFDLTHLDGNNINTLITHFQDLNNQLENEGSNDPATEIWTASSFYSTVSSLEHMLNRQNVLFSLLLFLTVILALLTAGTMSQVLVEHQAAAIGIMRSRGAGRRSIFWAFALQGGVLVALAALLGPLLAEQIGRVLASTLFANTYQSVIIPLTTHFMQTIQDSSILIILIMLLAIITLLVAIYRATQMNIVSFRREASRSTQRPFWRRYHVDIVLALIICVGYGFFAYLMNSAIAQNSLLQVLLGAFSLLMVPVILAAVTLLFLRFFPWISHLATRCIARIGSTAALLACAQIERAPRAASRLLLLLMVAMIASCYLLSLIATQEQWSKDRINFQLGADFQGTISSADQHKSLSQLQQDYGSIHGVQAVAPGYTEQGVHFPNFVADISLNAVDADTYARTAIWPTLYSQQPLTSLMQQLQAHRADASAQDTVYAFANEAFWRMNDLAPGMSLHLSLPGYTEKQSMHFIILGELTDIPGIYSTTDSSSSNQGLLTDFQSYAAVYARDNPGQVVTPNALWLKTASDAASLASVRTAFPTLQDNRALLAAAQVDPVQANIIGLLTIGVGVALLLALLGALMISWVSIYSRRAHFAALRALGMPARQIMRSLLFEYGVIYALALLISAGVSAMLSPNVLLVFDLINNEIYNNSGSTLNPLLSFPLEAAALLIGGLLALNAVALFLMALIATRPSLEKILRLNED